MVSSLIVKEKVAHIFKSITLNSNDLEFITKKFVLIHVKKGELLIQQGEEVTSQFYVVDGCLRTYQLEESGKESTIQFAIQDWWISDYIALWTPQKSVLNVACIKEANLLKISAEDLEQIYNTIPEVESFFRKKLEKAFVRQEKRILSILTKSAKERYLDFLHTYPNIEKHLKNYHIASYLGITTESLSRIRKEIAKS
ncbi:Crp/Fnr family transcriptional regulator [Tenacibaculum agarivorans]|uniref:Crp/Fnr family transcriptional regulator n=1 Tax=Tenacibaculum agarivorans TaxID=1908389 RepID=UPI000A7CEA96|nr:Crp/Fnr family transcriptional regulator [Tenacibaculum agarivorans]